MPSLFRIGKYIIYFWSNENGEPIHVHISEGIMSQNSTKVWLTKLGGYVVANNSSQIPMHELNKLLEVISAQFFVICAAWKTHFNVETIRFYC